MSTLFLVAWTQWAHGDDVHPTRVNAFGEVLDPRGIPVAILGADERLQSSSWKGGFPSIVRHRSAFLVAWEAGNPHAGAESSDIGLGVIAGSGQLQLRGQVIAAGGAGNEFGPVLDTGSDHALLLNHRVAHEPGMGGVTRLFARSVRLSTRMRPTRR